MLTASCVFRALKWNPTAHGHPHEDVSADVGLRLVLPVPRAVDSLEVARTLISAGFDELVVQKGNGQYRMRHLLHENKTSALLTNGMKVE